MRVHLVIRDWVIASPADMDALIDEIRGRLLEALEKDGNRTRVRIKGSSADPEASR